MRALTVLLCLLPSLVLADRVHMKNGRVLEGEVREDGDALIVTQGNGIEARIPRDMVLRVEAAESPQQRRQAELDALDGEDLEAHRWLAAWWDEQGRTREARELRERMLLVWPEDPVTRQALGYVRHEGQWITREDYMRSLGLVPTEDGSSWITEVEAARRARSAAAKRQEPTIRKALRGARKDAAQAEAKLADVSDEAAVPVLLDHVRADNLAVRSLAMRELGRRRARVAARELAEVAVEDPRQPARAEALEALRVIDHPSVPAYLVRQLDRPNVFQRVHAAHAVGVLASLDAIPALIVQLRQATSGFGRSSISLITQRAYIRDFELSSGGSGPTVAEVADPTVDFQSEGVVLDVKVIKWERYTVTQVLQRLTGQGFDADPDAWEEWWRGARDGFELPGDD
jgi:hypothetical protein